VIKNCNLLLMEIYSTLLHYFGPRDWWPADSRLEIIVGAILTQAVSWKNVEKAIANLKGAEVLDIELLHRIDENELAELIKPALYHRQKAKKVKAMIDFIYREYQADLDSMKSDDLQTLRLKLLSVWGVGPETADSILLYACEKKIFVVDAYTSRIFSRIGLLDGKSGYDEVQSFMQTYLPPQLDIYNEYHALIVALGAGYCRKTNPLCKKCPIMSYCKYSLNWQDN